MAKKKRLVVRVSEKGQQLKLSKKTQRNDPCRCGSKLKYKNCCLEQDEARYKITTEQRESYLK